MRMVKLGSQGLEVPCVGLGCMGMSDFYGTTNESDALGVLDRSLKLGCNFWDTSDMYGPWTNEEFLGQALKGRRDKVILATKFGVMRKENGDWLGLNGKPDYVKAACEASLKRLGADVIDLYYQHRVDPDVPIEETYGTLSELVAEGKVRFIGVSEASPEQIERAHAVHPLSAVQTEYSLWSRDVEADVLPAVARLGIGFVAYSPLGRGFLTGGITSRADLAADDWRLSNPRFTDEALAANARLVEQVRAIAEAKGAAPAQVALAWVLSAGETIAAIPGTRHVKYLEQNRAAADLALSADERAALDALATLPVVGDRY